ncbi:MAG TPA: hypothetical protein VKZ97_03715 [Flavobacteriaceae bacterium]|nr:hypothetical protein [Flavobacteriaceae bacterium]
MFLPLLAVSAEMLMAYIIHTVSMEYLWSIYGVFMALKFLDGN